MKLFFLTLLPFLRCFRKIAKKATICFMSVCLPVRPSIPMEQLGSHWMDCHEIWVFFESLSTKFNILYKIDKKKKVTLREDQ